MNTLFPLRIFVVKVIGTPVKQDLVAGFQFVHSDVTVI